ncbi:histidine--tRNA ligase [Candidatus Micrarchaeota archaeon]|nr:histidine--tRNA ligase [Candidatus Micrarchaeota archaeon]
MKLQPLKGTKDYLPDEQIVRNWIVDTLRRVFELYGYRPIETSILDFWEVGANKYAGGEEILKETYRLKDQGKRNLILRYELTFKLAKLIGMHPNMRMPFKRYEIGKVFRDGPVKTGRLREFTQCDVDIIGTHSMIADAELMSMVIDVFNRLKLDVYIQVNNKKLQFGLFKSCGITDDKLIPAALSLDKLVKYGKETVVTEMIEKGITKESIDKLFSIIESIESLPNNKRLNEIEKYVKDEEMGMEGLNEMKQFMEYSKEYGVEKDLMFLPSLARGLGYYTGMVWEVYLKNSKITSSVAAGGRWDNMISKFINSKRTYPATGITFGLDVIHEALKEKNMHKIAKTPLVYIIPIEENQIKYCITITKKLRSHDISCDIAFDKKLSKAMDYANKESIPYVIIIGEDEIKNNVIKLKNMNTGKEVVGKIEEITKHINYKRDSNEKG